ncbi:response regulator transcription factor [Pedococcus aerophilus]|uniref:Response regulator transcription factor n=2 Tax=Pedococcus aerophilus TaxID=436356 RepID=A0ABN3UVM4_9MICO
MLDDMGDAAGTGLLLVEDDRELSGLLVRLFEGQGYAVQAVRDVQSGLHAALTGVHAVMVVDRRLPDGDGVDLVSRLRRQGVTTPVLVLTAHGTVRDRVEGLDGGADDYLVKPFDSAELLARVRSLLRRHLDDGAVVLPLGAARLDTTTNLVTVPGRAPVELSPAEAAFLAQLARRPTRVFSRDELRDSLAPGTRSLSLVDTYVYGIRRKLGREVVRTVRGVGYRAGELGEA